MRKLSLDDNDVILAGHDPVAYFTENRPVPGSPEFTAAHGGAIYRFSSEANRDLFRANPEKYAPLYGGYCANGMAAGLEFAVSGTEFQIVDERLYVNKDPAIHEAWCEDIAGNIAKANHVWSGIDGAGAYEPTE